jgi:hypothetical protein
VTALSQPCHTVTVEATSAFPGPITSGNCDSTIIGPARRSTSPTTVGASRRPGREGALADTVSALLLVTLGEQQQTVVHSILTGEQLGL